jgi:membrane associated rhomboid family serine protease
MKLFSILPSSFIAVGIMWIVFLIDVIWSGSFHHFGILPRTLEGLWHIPIAPFIHGDIFHLIGNTLPLMGIGFMIQMKDKKIFWELFAILAVLGGLSTWLIGSHAYHIGASGVLIGLWSFLIADAVFTRSLKAFFIAGITIVFYGFIVFSVFSFRAHISVSGHLSGFIMGILVAYLASKGKKISTTKSKRR